MLVLNRNRPVFKVSVDGPEERAVTAAAESAVVRLRDKTGRQYRLNDATTRIARFTGNETGTGFRDHQFALDQWRRGAGQAYPEEFTVEILSG